MASIEPIPVTAQANDPPFPRPKPSIDAVEHDRSGGVTGPNEQIGRNDLAPVADNADCERELTRLDVQFTRLEPIAGKDGCEVPTPYDVQKIAKNVTLRPTSKLSCKALLAIARWTKEVVSPAARALGDGTRLEGIRHGSTYVCRSRADQTKLSEHARGTAIDVLSFEFEGHVPIAIVPRAGDGDLQEAFQRAVRSGACLYFTTVLGPGTDEAHDDHLHLDLAQRNRGYRLCQ